MDSFRLKFTLLRLFLFYGYNSKRLDILKYSGNACDIDDEVRLLSIHFIFILFTVVSYRIFLCLGI